MPQTLGLELWFANQDALVDVLRLSELEAGRLLAASADTQRDMARKQHELTRRLERSFGHEPPPELQTIMVSSQPRHGQLISIEQAFYFRREPDHVLLHAQLNTDPTWQVRAKIDPARFPFSSTYEFLSGRRSVFMIATTSSVGSQSIDIRPVFIGQRSWSDGGTPESSYSRRVYPQAVNQFSQTDWLKPLTSSESKVMQNMREELVKNALAKIVGVSFVPKDWGGERSDISTNNLLVDGTQTSAAWLLKGRSVQGPMKVRHLGVNGDQVERLATEPSELLIVQHNHHITAAVVNLARAFAHDMRNPRRFMIMDGQATGMILRDYGYLH